MLQLKVDGAITIASSIEWCITKVADILTVNIYLSVIFNTI